ncbi:MAG: class I SAM-dependent methyltransferase [Sulfuriferula sp.]
MSIAQSDKLFAGSIPALYEAYLVPLIFGQYAEGLAKRLAARKPARVLEVAAGTGVLTRQLAALLPSEVSIVATDLNQPMLDMASGIGTVHPVEWQQADVMQLPFEANSFDAVACQFGVMFFPNKLQAYAEIRRVLKPGGVLLFNVWDRIEENEFAHAVSCALEAIFPEDTPYFMARTPHGYYDIEIIRQDLRNSGFISEPAFDTVSARSIAESASIAALAYCQGTPLRNEIETRNSALLDRATQAAENAIAARFGHGRIDGKIQAHVVEVER